MFCTENTHFCFSSLVTYRKFIYHENGKLLITSKTPLTLENVGKQYTPGVASVCRVIAADPKLVRKHTMASRTVGIFSNGSAVLGEGDIGLHFPPSNNDFKNM